MRIRLSPWLTQLLFAFAGLALFALAFKDQPIQEIAQTLSEADYRWAGLILFISTGSHLLRALRWRLLIEPIAPKPPIATTFWSLMLGYLVSLAIPRLGELSRSAALGARSQAPFKPLFGTVITERIIDIVCLLLAISLAFAIEAQQLRALFMQEVYPHLGEAVAQRSMALRAFGIAAVIAFALSLAYVLAQWKTLRKRYWVRRLWLMGLQVWKGAASIAQLKRPWAFAGYTIAIWLSYYLMTFLWFFSFEATEGLGWRAGLSMMVIGSVGRSLPIQGGGAGAYHYLFIQGMLLYGIAQMHGGALALLIHGFQTCYMLLIGAAAMLVLGLRPHAHK